MKSIILSVILLSSLYYVTSHITGAVIILDDIPTRKLIVGDINVGYKMIGNGPPLIMIPGFSMTMDMWDSSMVEKLSENHTVILFDNREIGSTIATNNSNRSYSIEELANDIGRLIDALKIEKPVDILGLSMGGFIAQELALSHPEKVNKLIIFASNCGGKYTIPPQVSPEVLKVMLNGNASLEQFISTLFPSKWIQENREYIRNNIILPVDKVSRESLLHQAEANFKWQGACERLSSLKMPVLVLIGTEDITSPPSNSLMIAQKIPGAWLVQIREGGHGVMFQYPEKVSNIIKLFLSRASS